MRRCWTAPNDLKIAPWTMSVPIAIDGLKPKNRTRSGVISEPPPIPVTPTRSPISRPARESFQSMTAGPRGRGSALAGRLGRQQDLFQRVRAEAEAERLDGDHLVGRDVAEVDVRAEVLHEPRLRRLGRRLEEEVVDGDLVRELVDQPRAHVPVRPEDPGGAALASFRDHLPGARRQLLLDPLDPLVRGVHDVR